MIGNWQTGCWDGYGEVDSRELKVERKEFNAEFTESAEGRRRRKEGSAMRTDGCGHEAQRPFEQSPQGKAAPLDEPTGRDVWRQRAMLELLFPNTD